MGFLDPFKRLRRRKLLTAVRRADGSIMLADQRTLDFLDSEAPLPSEVSLDRVFSSAVRVRVFDGGTDEGKALGSQLLLMTEVGIEIAELRACLSIAQSGSGFHCMCCGDLAIEVSNSEGVQAVIGLHHGQSIRWDPEWSSDAELADAQRLIDWLAARGVEGPRRELEARKEAGRLQRQAYERWRSAMPACLESLWPSLEEEPLGTDSRTISRVVSALRAAHASEEDVILALLAWYGQGAGPWSGYPAYEGVAGNLLLAFSTGAILRSLESRELDPKQIEGAARLLSGWEFGRFRSDDRRLLSPALRDRLRAHMELSSSDANRALFAAAFPLQPGSPPGPC